MKSKPKLSILVPVRNEGVNIALMLKVLNAVVDLPHEVLVVYDTDDDDTVPVVKGMQRKHQNVRLIKNRIGQGVSNAINAGIESSVGEYILIVVADEIPPVLIVEDMVALMDEGCDLVSATRYEHGGRRMGGNLAEGILSKIGNRIFRLLSGSALTDATTGVKMFRKTIFEKIKLEAAPVGWVVVFELAIKAQAAGLRLGEVPMTSVDRLYGGKSTFSLIPWFKEYLRWFFWGVVRIRKNGAGKMGVRVRTPKITVN